MSDCQLFSFIPDSVVPDSTITARTTIENYPVENLKHYSESHSSRWSSSTAVVIDISFDSLRQINSVVIPDINLTTTGRIDIQWFSDEFTTIEYNSTIENPDGLNVGGGIPPDEFVIGLHTWGEKRAYLTNTGIVDSSDAKICKSVRITIIDTDNTDDIDVRMLIIGISRSFSNNYTYGSTFSQLPEKTINRAKGGRHLASGVIGTGRVITLPLELTDEDTNSMMRYEKLYKNNIWFFDLRPWSSLMQHRFSNVGEIQSITYTHKTHNFWSFNLEIKEV